MLPCLATLILTTALFVPILTSDNICQFQQFWQLITFVNFGNLKFNKHVAMIGNFNIDNKSQFDVGSQTLAVSILTSRKYIIDYVIQFRNNNEQVYNLYSNRRNFSE